MAYQKIGFVDEKTPLSAKNLNHMEEAIYKNSMMREAQENFYYDAVDPALNADSLLPVANRAVALQFNKSPTLADCVKLPEGADLNDPAYLLVGNYSVYMNSVVATLVNCPVSTAFKMTVETADGLHGNPVTEDNVNYYNFRRIIVTIGGEVLQQRISYGNTTVPVLGEWEWWNPPMEYDTEYRTTERHRGSPIYIAKLNIGGIYGLAAGGTKEVGFPESVNMSNGVVSAQTISIENGYTAYRSVECNPAIRELKIDIINKKITVTAAEAITENIVLACIVKYLKK